MIFLITFRPALSEDAAMTTRPALNQPASPTTVGLRPYEMEGRTEDRAPLVDFEDLNGWTIQCLNGADADLVRAREQRMWGRYVGKVEYKGTSAESKVILRPPAPVPVKNAFDCINMWIYGRSWEWSPDPGTPFLDVSILVTDGSGKEQRISLTRVRWKEWWLVHKKLDQAMQSAAFTGIEISGMWNTEPRSIFLDSLCFYKEALKPLKFAPRPSRNLTLLPGQDQGLNGTGPGKLPIPTREETILPANFVREYKNAVREASPGVYEFTYTAKDAGIRYVYKPATGDLGEIIAYVNGRKVCAPMTGGGIQMADGSTMPGKLLDSHIDKGIVTATFDFGGAQAEYRLRIWGKSLVMDFICRGGNATGLTFGEFTGLRNPKLVVVPFLTFGSNPRVLCFGNKTSPLFASVWADWYRSNGSALYAMDSCRVDAARINGGVKYTAKTDGKRNDLYERVFLTVSPTFEETLPTIANPPTPHGKVAGERLWQESWGPENYAKEHERSKMLRSYGIDKLTQCNHEITWRDGGESFTLRTKAAPKRGGDKALQDYVAAQKSLGWLSGLYTNYCDFAPVNEHWSEDYAQRAPEGEWRAAWPRCYALKPSRAVELDAELAPIVQRKFGSNAAYTDVQTAVAPWNYCDFDARVPGAGTFAATFYAYGELLLHDQKVYGPTWSEGTYQCFYAGLATGNYGLAYNGMDFSKEPLNVAFDLLKIHPLECDIGMPWTGGFFKEAGWEKPEKIDESIDHFIAATLAYGHIGWLVEESHGIQRTCRSYYMLQQLQKRYALQKPVVIEYADQRGRMQSVSRAIASDVISDSRLHVRYENGLDLYVNGSRDNWAIKGHDGKAVELPPWGWYARHESSRFTELSALVNGQRIDCVRSPEHEYLDGHGVQTVYEGLAARGAIAVRGKGSSIEVIDIGGNTDIGVRVAGPCKCKAFGLRGETLGPVDLRHTSGDMAWIKVVPKARKYVLTPDARGLPERSTIIRFPRDAVVAGEELPAVIEMRLDRTAIISDACVAIEGMKPVRIGEWSGLKAMSARKYSVTLPLRFPKKLKTGSNVWVKVSIWTGSSKEMALGSWAVLRVVSPFEIGLSKIDEGRYHIDLRNNLYRPGDPEVSIALKSGNTGIEITGFERKGRTVEIRPPSKLEQVSDTVVVQVREKERVVTSEFRIQALVEYPLVWRAGGDESYSWGCAFRGGDEMSGNSDTGASFYFADITCGGVSKHGIFSHPPYRNGVGYTYGILGPVVIPDDDCEFRAFIGLKDGGDTSDGVVFQVLALDESGREYLLVRELWDKREWKAVSASLSAFSGRKIRLKLIADVGPHDNSSADWASWGEPRIVETTSVMRIEVGR